VTFQYRPNDAELVSQVVYMDAGRSQRNVWKKQGLSNSGRLSANWDFRWHFKSKPLYDNSNNTLCAFFFAMGQIPLVVHDFRFIEVSR